MRPDLRMQKIDPMRNSRNKMAEPAMTPVKVPFAKCVWLVELGGVMLDAMPDGLEMEISFAGDQHLVMR
jgi:hypothetical protein